MTLSAKWEYNADNLETNGTVYGDNTNKCKEKVVEMLKKLYNEKEITKNNVEITEKREPDWAK